MKLTAKVLKQIIREQMQNLKEEVKYLPFNPHSGAIYFINQDGTKDSYYLMGEKAVKKNPNEKVVRADPGTPERKLYDEMIRRYQQIGYSFQPAQGGFPRDLVVPPMEKAEPAPDSPADIQPVEFFFRYVRQGNK